MIRRCFLYYLTFLLVCSVLSLNVYAADSALENADLGAIAAGLDNAGLVLDANDLADDTADIGDLVANRKVVSHIGNLFLLLLLGTDAYEVENDYYRYEHTNGEKGASNVATEQAGKSISKCNCIEHFFISFLKYRKF